jgi:hypothetical protein
MEPLVPDPSANGAMSSWGIHGDAGLLVEAARRLRLGIAAGVYRSRPPGEYAMFGVARLLDAVAFSMRVDGATHPRVVSAATEVAHHVLTYQLPDDADRRAPR